MSRRAVLSPGLGAGVPAGKTFVPLLSGERNCSLASWSPAGQPGTPNRAARRCKHLASARGQTSFRPPPARGPPVRSGVGTRSGVQAGRQAKRRKGIVKRETAAPGLAAIVARSGKCSSSASWARSRCCGKTARSGSARPRRSARSLAIPEIRSSPRDRLHRRSLWGAASADRVDDCGSTSPVRKALDPAGSEETRQ